MSGEVAEREYLEAKAAYDKALARLIAAKKARPRQEPVVRIGSLRQMAREREAIWQAYLAGDRDYEAMARRFGRTRGNITSVIRNTRQERAFGPPTAEEYRYNKMLQDVLAQVRGQ